MNRTTNKRREALGCGLGAALIATVAIAGNSMAKTARNDTSSDAKASTPVAELAISREFLERLSRFPVVQGQDVVTTIDRTTIATRIKSNGVANVTPWATGKDGLGFCVLATNDIHADIDATIRGPARIFVQTDAVADTKAASRKCFLLDDNGLRAYPAATNASTHLEVIDLDVWAGGVFRKIKKRLGQRRAEQELAKRVPENEREVNQRAISTINDLLDNKTKGLMAKANTMWREWLRDATLRNKVLANPPKFSTTEDAIRMFIPGSRSRQDLQLLPAAGEAILARIQRAYLREIAQIYLAGLTISDGEILAVMKPDKGDYTSVDQVLGSPDDVTARFVATNPADFTMTNDVITAKLSFAEVSTRGAIFKGIDLVFPVHIRNDAGRGVMVVLPEQIEALDRNSGLPHEALTQIFTGRWRAFATSREFSAEELRKRFAPGLPSRLSQLTARDDVLGITTRRGDEVEFDQFTRKISDRFSLGNSTKAPD